MNLIDFFQAATGNLPYDYQSRLAGGDAGIECRSQLIHISTGLGKTAAVTLAWLKTLLRAAGARASRWDERHPAQAT